MRLAATGAVVTALALLLFPRGAAAFPPPGSESVPVSGSVSITSRLGQETVHLDGTMTVQRGAPRMEGSVEVVDTEIVALSLTGDSVTGPVTVDRSPSLASTGQLRSLQTGASFPASSFFDVFVDSVIPASGYGSPSPFHVHNDVPLRLIATASTSYWPPPTLEYRASPSPCVKLLRNVADPRSSDLWLPAQICITNASFTITGPAVGGVTELSAIEPPAANSTSAPDSSGPSANAAAIIGGVIAAAAVGGAFLANRRRRH